MQEISISQLIFWWMSRNVIEYLTLRREARSWYKQDDSTISLQMQEEKERKFERRSEKDLGIVAK